MTFGGRNYFVSVVVGFNLALIGGIVLVFWFYAPNVNLGGPLRPIAVRTITIKETLDLTESRTAHMEYEASKGLVFGFRWPEE
jgi:hypothetical protein